MVLSVADAARMEEFWRYCQKHQYFNIGYPESADFDYSPLYRFFDFSLNNCGDWQEPGNYALNSFAFEKEVMRHFARHFHIPFADSWGYVTNGGTEGNMFACYLARELFPQATLYYSADSHYSVMKIARILQMKSCRIRSLPNGEMDIDQLIEKIQQHQDRHPLVWANIGTTMLGAVDDIRQIQQRISALGIAREDYYLHADAALSGMILPFVDQPQPFSFADGVDSICVSGHKMIGSPIPCGIVLTKKQYIEKIAVAVDYIMARDQTISGSRNGHTVLLLWAALRGQTFQQQKQRVQHCLHMAQYAVERFQAQGIQAWRHRNSITVVFPCPSAAVWKKHYLAVSGHVAHLITSGHHKATQHIDRLIEDVAADLRHNPSRDCVHYHPAAEENRTAV